MKKYLLLLFGAGALAGPQAPAQSLPSFHTSGDSLVGLTAAREATMRQALSLFECVMNDTAFQHELLRQTFYYDVPDDPNRSLPTRAAVTKLYAAHEHYTPAADGTANVYWCLRKKRRPLFSPHPALGYGLPSEKEIYTYTWFFDGGDLPAVVGHVAHEWSHKVGFRHLYKRHSRRDETLPYVLGALVARHARRLAGACR